jgi:hypothetical protein
MENAPLFTEDIDYIERPDGVKVYHRRAFCRDYFYYEPGEHVVFGGPSTYGKTTMAMDLIEYVVNPDFPAFIAVSKPRDAVTEQRGLELGFRRVSEWPPPVRIQEMFGKQKPSGYLVWAKFGDMNTDMARSAALTAKLLDERYASGVSKKNKGGVLVMDDTMIKGKIQGLDNQMVTILAMAGAMDIGLWTFVQKPTDSGRTATWSYEQSTHLFFTKGGDDAMKRRYREIIGEKGPIAIELINSLEPYQFLYFHRKKGWMCIVGAN